MEHLVCTIHISTGSSLLRLYCLTGGKYRCVVTGILQNSLVILPRVT